MIHPDIQEIINVLKDNINEIDNPKKKDICYAILAWLKEKPHVIRLVEEIASIDNKDNLVKIKEIVQKLVSLEI